MTRFQQANFYTEGATVTRLQVAWYFGSVVFENTATVVSWPSNTQCGDPPRHVAGNRNPLLFISGSRRQEGGTHDKSLKAVGRRARVLRASRLGDVTGCRVTWCEWVEQGASKSVGGVDEVNMSLKERLGPSRGGITLRRSDRVQS